MSPVKFCLLGSFSVLQDDRELKCFQSTKAKELFCYLSLHRDRPHCREILANLLWSECTTTQSRKYFRQTLWQLQQTLQALCPSGQVRGLHVEGESLRLDFDTEFWLDIAVFEKAFAPVRGISGDQMDERQAQILLNAVSLYRGDLLEGWFQDWCLYHRERLQSVYLAILDKLMEYCEYHRDYERGLIFGERLLHQDNARERTYFRLMRLHYFAGDRAGALRQFHRCAAALEKELGVKPAQRTIELYDQIRADGLKIPVLTPPETAQPNGEKPALSPLFPRLKSLRSLLLKLQQRVEQDIHEVDRALASHAGRSRSGRD